MGDVLLLSDLHELTLHFLLVRKVPLPDLRLKDLLALLAF